MCFKMALRGHASAIADLSYPGQQKSLQIMHGKKQTSATLKGYMEDKIAR